MFSFTSCRRDLNRRAIFSDFITSDLVVRPAIDLSKTKEKAAEALQFCKMKNYNTQYCILIDMSLHSGINRFVVWNYKQNAATHKFLVAHGSGDYAWNHDYSKEQPAFSNEENSHCSSLGKYKIGTRAPSEWGVKIKYELHGLEKSNNNALSRFVVFHSWERVSDVEVYPAGTPEGWGCPVLSLKNFITVDSILKGSKKPVLMWIYN